MPKKKITGKKLPTVAAKKTTRPKPATAAETFAAAARENNSGLTVCGWQAAKLPFNAAETLAAKTRETISALTAKPVFYPTASGQREQLRKVERRLDRIEGAIDQSTSRLCRTPGCGIRFFPTRSNQIRHSRSCAVKASKLKRTKH